MLGKLSVLNVKLLVTVREQETEISTVDIAKLSICQNSGEAINHIFMYRRKR